jgi:hypothetical protein
MKDNYNRIAACALPAAAIALIIALWPQAGLGRDAAGPQDTWAKYQIILQRNIFSRQRGPIRRRERDIQPVTRRVVTPNPESYFLLRGISQEDDTFIAFVEDTRSGEVLRLHEGDSVARGKVKALTLDSIEYQLGEDSTITIAMGQDLEGGRGAVTMGTLLELSAAPSPTGEQADTTQEQPPSEDEAEILRKLMEQRRQELGQ